MINVQRHDNFRCAGTVSSQASLKPHAGSAPTRIRSAFTLTEVLIATIILGIGLIGLGAIFPAVISQQQQATDLSSAITAGENAEGLLRSRAEGIRDAVLDPNSNWDVQSGGEWVPVSYRRPQRDVEGYLRMPYGLGIPIPEEDIGIDMLTVVQNGGAGIARPRVGTVALPYRPIREAVNGIRVVVQLYDANTGDPLTPFFLSPDPGAAPPLSEFRASSPGRLASGEPNAINYGNAEIQFHFRFNPATEEVRRDSVQVDYEWLDDLIVSNPDRVYPQDAPRLAWEMLLRKGVGDQVQYCLFMYRFDVPEGFEFDPPDADEMLLEGSGRIERDVTNLGNNQRITRFYLETDDEDVLERGAWILPVDGVAPIKIRRVGRDADLRGGTEDTVIAELDAAPVRVDEDGIAEPIVGNVEFWYLPLEVVSPNDEDNVMRIRPVLAYTKQLNF